MNNRILTKEHKKRIGESVKIALKGRSYADIILKLENKNMFVE